MLVTAISVHALEAWKGYPWVLMTLREVELPGRWPFLLVASQQTAQPSLPENASLLSIATAIAALQMTAGV